MVSWPAAGEDPAAGEYPALPMKVIPRTCTRAPGVMPSDLGLLAEPPGWHGRCAPPMLAAGSPPGGRPGEVAVQLHDIK